MHASGGRDGILRTRVWVEDIVLPLGNNTLIGLVAILQFFLTLS